MNRRGFSLIELAVVLALIGITATVAGVSLSSGDAELRTKVRDVRFALEKAKQESLARGRNVYVEFFDGPYAFDCNRDGLVNEKDLCSGYRDACCVLYADRWPDEENAGGYDAEKHEIVDCLELPVQLELSDAGVLRFSPFGGSRAVEVEMSAAGRTYRVRVNHVGGIEIRQPSEEY